METERRSSREAGRGAELAARLAVEGGTPVRNRPFPAWPVHGDPERAAVERVARSGHWGSTSGDEVHRFEAAFADFQGARHAVAVCNGTVALAVALRASGVGFGDEVVVPAYTFIASATSVLLIGAIPVMVDVLPDTLLVDPEQVRQAVGPRTRAVMPVHIAGACCDMDALGSIARDSGLRVVEDAAQACGAEWRGRPVGTLGDMGCFSFQSNKALNAGEGGMVVSDSPELAERAWSAANVGRIRDGGWYQHKRVGWNFRMTEFQGALLQEQLKRLPGILERRARNAAVLVEGLRSIPGIRLLERDARITRDPWQVFYFRLGGSLRAQGLERFVAALKAEGIPCMTGYRPLNQSAPLLEEIRARRPDLVPLRDCPVAEEASLDTVLLPHWTLLGDADDVSDIVRAVERVATHLVRD